MCGRKDGDCEARRASKGQRRPRAASPWLACRQRATTMAGRDDDRKTRLAATAAAGTGAGASPGGRGSQRHGATGATQGDANGNETAARSRPALAAGVKSALEARRHRSARSGPDVGPLLMRATQRSSAPGALGGRARWSKALEPCRNRPERPPLGRALAGIHRGTQGPPLRCTALRGATKSTAPGCDLSAGSLPKVSILFLSMRGRRGGYYRCCCLQR